MATQATYPVRVEAHLEPPLSRWLWLVKWFLAIPHYVLLFFLWIAFFTVSVIAFFAILFTGRYPRALFDFNVGVLRWSWRVAYYTYGALGTDTYPPFTLEETADFPAQLQISYPQHLSRGLVLVKWWLLAIPHYLIVALLAGGAWVFGRTAWPSGGLIGILVIIAAVILAFTGRYPQQMFDLILGLNRWVLRVAAYAGLMTDEYPPFRLDMGGDEPAGTFTVPEAPPVEPGHARKGWTGGRIVALVMGILLGLGSMATLAAGGVALWADKTQRDVAGFVTSDEQTFSTRWYALTTEDIEVPIGGARAARSLLGDVRIRVTALDPAAPIFVGIAPSAAAASYLSNVAHGVITDFADASIVETRGGEPPAAMPEEAEIWAVSAGGTGTQEVVWSMRGGSWTLVAMNADGSGGVGIAADAGARLPALPWVALGLLVGGGLAFAGSVALVAIPIARASRT